MIARCLQRGLCFGMGFAAIWWGALMFHDMTDEASAVRVSILFLGGLLLVVYGLFPGKEE